MRFSIMHITCMILVTFNDNKILLNFDRLISDEQNKSEFPAQCRSNGEKELTFFVGDENQCKVYVTFGRVFMEDLQKITTGNTVSFSYNEKYKTNSAKFETWLMLKTTFYTKTFSAILPPSEKQCEEFMYSCSYIRNRKPSVDISYMYESYSVLYIMINRKKLLHLWLYFSNDLSI